MKGQVSLYILVGLVLFSIFAFLFYLGGTDVTTDPEPALSDLSAQNCLEQVSTSVFEDYSQLTHDSSIKLCNRVGANAAYYEGREFSCIGEVYGLADTVQDDLEKLIDVQMTRCLEQVEQSVDVNVSVFFGLTDVQVRNNDLIYTIPIRFKSMYTFLYLWDGGDPTLVDGCEIGEGRCYLDGFEVSTRIVGGTPIHVLSDSGSQFLGEPYKIRIYG